MTKAQNTNSALLSLLVCPVSLSGLIYDKGQAELVSLQTRLAFPIQDGVPVMLENAARKIARGGTDGPQGTAEGAGSLVEPIVDLKIYERSVEASAQVVKTADETLGTLLDIMA